MITVYDVPEECVTVSYKLVVLTPCLCWLKRSEVLVCHRIITEKKKSNLRTKSYKGLYISVLNKDARLDLQSIRSSPAQVMGSGWLCRINLVCARPKYIYPPSV